MRWAGRFLAAALPLLLAACAPPPLVKNAGDAAQYRAQLARERALAPVDHWQLEGRLGVSDGEHGGSGSFHWQQDGQHYVFELRGPAISGANFRLSGDARGAVLEGIEGGPLRGPDAEALMRRALGWEVPLDDLRAWVRGLRADSGPASLSFGAHGLPSQLVQDGWTVEYRAWDTARAQPLPTKIFARRSPYKLRLSVESWTFD